MDWLRQRALKWLVGSGQVASIVRHGLSALGAVLVTAGVSSDAVNAWIDPTTDLVVGLLLAGIAYLSSRVNKQEEK